VSGAIILAATRTRIARVLAKQSVLARATSLKALQMRTLSALIHANALAERTSSTGKEI
jgi:hypothetical protein